MQTKPKICIVFNAGAAGDFLVTLLTHQQLKTGEFLIINELGTVSSASGHSFKKACREFYESNFDPSVFSHCEMDPIVNTHFYYQELNKLFPECRFYYIDDSKFQHITINAYIKKRVVPHYSNLLRWLQSAKHIPFAHKIKYLSDEQIIKIMTRDWKRNTTQWADHGLPPINFSDIVSKEKCRILIENVLQCSIHEEIFSTSHNMWSSKNKEIIEKVNDV